MGANRGSFGRRRPDVHAIPGCLPLRAEGATALAKNRLHQVDSGPARWASSRHTRRAGTRSVRGGADVGNRCEQRVPPEVVSLPPGNYIQQVRPGSPAKRPLRPGQQTEACASRGHGTNTREETAPASPPRPPDRPGWPHTSRAGRRPGQGRPRPGTCCCEDARAPARAQGRRCRHPGPARRAESGGR
jgi:hypothetical protein